MRGRKPVPTPLRILRGNPSKRALPKRGPTTPAHLPAAPLHLGKEGRKEWYRIGRKLVRLGLMTDLDRATLAAYCSAWERYAEAEARLREYGLVLPTRDKEAPSPYVGIANRAMEVMLKVAAEFGLTPSSRTRLKTGEGQAVDPVEEYLSGRRDSL